MVRLHCCFMQKLDRIWIKLHTAHFHPQKSLYHNGCTTGKMTIALRIFLWGLSRSQDGDGGEELKKVQAESDAILNESRDQTFVT